MGLESYHHPNLYDVAQLTCLNLYLVANIQSHSLCSIAA